MALHFKGSIPKANFTVAGKQIPNPRYYVKEVTLIM